MPTLSMMVTEECFICIYLDSQKLVDVHEETHQEPLASEWERQSEIQSSWRYCKTAHTFPAHSQCRLWHQHPWGRTLPDWEVVGRTDTVEGENSVNLFRVRDKPCLQGLSNWIQYKTLMGGLGIHNDRISKFQDSLKACIQLLYYITCSAIDFHEEI